MATRKPLVINAGQIQQLQVGDTLDASVIEQEVTQLTNGEATSIVIGAPVYIFSANTVKKAKADAGGTSNPIGLVKDASIAASAEGAILTSGILTATTGEWDAVAGTTGGLTPNAVYYLDPANGGKITATAPSVAGQYVVKVGVAISTTELKLDIEPSVLL